MKQGIHPQRTKKRPIVVLVVQNLRPVPLKRTSGLKFAPNAHPFFTGRQKLVDTGGRVDRFNRRFNRGTKAE